MGQQSVLNTGVFKIKFFLICNCFTYVQIKSKSNIDCTARCCIPQTKAFVLLVKNLRVVALTTLSSASLVLTSSAEIGGSLIDCCGEPKPFSF